MENTSGAAPSSRGDLHKPLSHLNIFDMCNATEQATDPAKNNRTTMRKQAGTRPLGTRSHSPQRHRDFGPTSRRFWPDLALTSPRGFGELGSNCPARGNAGFKPAGADLRPLATQPGVAHDQADGRGRVRGCRL